MNRFAKWLVALALVGSIGGHWALLQGLAWTTMLARFSQSMPFTEAVASTFDGKHPCKMCLAVQKGQQEESKEAKFKPSQKLLLILDAPGLVLLSPPPFPTCGEFCDALESRSEKPPRPPPRGLDSVSTLIVEPAAAWVSLSPKARSVGVWLQSSADRIATQVSASDREPVGGGSWELPRWDVQMYPDCEKRSLPAKSPA